MADKKIIAVAGATGSQGGGLVRAIQSDPNSPFQARALTRDPGSDAAQRLADLGAEVVAADVDDLESLKAAFAGAWGAYCVTFFWNHFSPEREQAQARAMAEAAAAAGLQHVVWSTLEDTRHWVPLDDPRMPTLMERYKVPHFDAKAEADRFFTDLGLPTTFLLTSFYWDNLIHFGMGPRRGEDGVLGFALPIGASPMAGIAAEDIGRCAYGLFKDSAAWIGKRVGVCGEQPTGAQMAAALGEALGEEVRFIPIPVDVYRGLGFPGAEDLGNMFQIYEEFSGPFGDARSVATSRALNPSLQTFREWLSANAERIPIG